MLILIHVFLGYSQDYIIIQHYSFVLFFKKTTTNFYFIVFYFILFYFKISPDIDGRWAGTQHGSKLNLCHPVSFLLSDS